MTSEADIQTAIMLAAGSRPDVRLFRNNTGTAWQGKDVTPPDMRGRCIILEAPRPVSFGLFTGSPDLVGWQTITHGNRTLAVFLGIEVKTPRGVVSDDQRRFLDAMRARGGIGGVARSPEDALKFLL